MKNEIALEKAQEELRWQAPKKCRDCKKLIPYSEDNRFFVPARYKGDRQVHGEIDVFPFCEKYDEFCYKIKKEFCNGK